MSEDEKDIAEKNRKFEAILSNAERQFNELKEITKEGYNPELFLKSMADELKKELAILYGLFNYKPSIFSDN